MARVMGKAGLGIGDNTQRWYKALNVQGMEYRGDKCCAHLRKKRNGPGHTLCSCMVLLRESPAMCQAWQKQKVDHPHMQLCTPLAIVAGFVQLEGEPQPFALVRVVPPQLIIPHDRLRCRLVVGWKTYLALARDLRLPAQLVPVSDIQGQAVVVNCSGNRLRPGSEPTSKPARRAWRESNGAALGVVPYM